MLRFAEASGEFVALFHLIRHGFAVTPSPQGEGFWGAPAPVHQFDKSQFPGLPFKVALCFLLFIFSKSVI